MMSVEIKDPVSALTHFVGAILSFIAATQLVSKAYYTGSVIQLIGFGVFGASLVLLYSASTVYHIVKRPRRISILLKRIDHMMIFALIAGTYTPVCLIPLGGAFGNPLGITVLAVIWSAAVIGIFLKIIWLSAPRWLCTMQYILMGWIAVFAVVPLFGKMTHMGFSGWLPEVSSILSAPSSMQRNGHVWIPDGSDFMKYSICSFWEAVCVIISWF